MVNMYLWHIFLPGCDAFFLIKYHYPMEVNPLKCRLRLDVILVKRGRRVTCESSFNSCGYPSCELIQNKGLGLNCKLSIKLSSKQSSYQNRRFGFQSSPTIKLPGLHLVS